VKRLADAPPAIDRPRVAFVDLDGTLLGPGGSLFTTADGRSTLRAAQAVEELREAGVELVPTSGRSRRGMFEAARLLGARSYIAELGALLVEQVLPEEIVIRNYDGDRSPYLEMARSGAAGYLLERFRGRLEPHTPWSRRSREATMLFRGLVDAAEADLALAQAGYGWLRLHDNGRIGRSSPTLRDPEVRAYHLTPRGVSKASAAGLFLRRRGVAPERAVAIGDSVADLEIGLEVAAVVIVANGVASLDGADHDRAWSTEGSHGDGFAEAVDALLRGPPT
jgi:hydroxymethylpyrimidine pyrophosphatase-like HAD family hydrolase